MVLQEIPVNPVHISVEVQWDLIEKAHEVFALYSPGTIERKINIGTFTFHINNIRVEVHCRYNTAVRTDPDRIEVERDNHMVWCCSLYSYLNDHEYSEPIHAFLMMQQQQITRQNESAWNQNNYQALLNRHGNPEFVATKIKKNPVGRLGSLSQFLQPVKHKKIIHLMGSNGIKAVALAHQGAEVTVVVFSQENAAYAREVASAAGASIEYIVADVLGLKEVMEGDCYDIVLLELGVLHYFIDLRPLIQTVHHLLRKGGKLLLHEFHPISTKLITSKGRKHKITGNYFDPRIESRLVAFTKYFSGERAPETKVFQRKWTMGELVTAVAQEGLYINTKGGTQSEGS